MSIIFPIVAPDALRMVRFGGMETPALMIERLPVEPPDEEGAGTGADVRMSIDTSRTLFPVLCVELDFGPTKVRAGFAGPEAAAWLEETITCGAVALMPVDWHGGLLPVFRTNDDWRRAVAEYARLTLEAYRRVFPPAARN